MRWGDHLNALVEALIKGDHDAIHDACSRAQPQMGEDAVRDTLIVAAAFNGITRVADATGIPLDPPTATATGD
ncbi:MAG: hypothetical protein HC809_09485, partial [Gammaproteobacteria bacterium]|nr:hypothetical protein [Gammaproteobacteria bacterium]